MFCIHCGKQLEDGSRFCQYCGNAQTPQQAAPAPAAPVAPPPQIPFDPQVDLYPDAPQVPTYQPAPMPRDANVYADYMAPKPKKKSKAGLVIALVLVFVLLIGGGVVGFLAFTGIRAEAYLAAEDLLEQGDYDGALEAFRELGNFDDAAQRAEELEELQEEYDEALELLEDGDYDEAYEAFCDLGDYKDAAERASESCLNAALELLEQDDYEAAQALKKHMNEADAAAFVEAFNNASVDGRFIRDLAAAMVTWYDDAGSYGYAEELEIAWDMMSVYEGADFIDPNLADRLADFQYALSVMYNALEDEDSVGVWSEYYLGEYFLYTLADQMYEGYGMFTGDQENIDRFIGGNDIFLAYSDLEYSFENWWETTADTFQMDDGYYYTSYTNDTDYAFDLYATIYFFDYYDNLLETGEEMTIYVAKGATIYIPLIPVTISDSEWNSWNIYWDFGNIS